MSQTEKPTAAFVLSFIAGILILINGATAGVIGSFIGGIVPSFIPPSEYTTEAAGGLAIASMVLYVIMAVGVVFGILVLLGSFMVYRNPMQKTGWGVVILVLSILSIVTGGGFFIGFILGIIGGALALAWKPKASTAEPTTSAAPTT